jgi:hypothetical protein
MRRLGLVLIVTIGVGVTCLPSVASAATHTVVAYEREEILGYGAATRYWLPSEVTIGHQEFVSSENTVTFENNNTLVKHGVVWTSGPETPSCPGVPLNEGKVSWHGTCTFSHAGLYAFHCYVHPTEMTGTIVVVGTPTAATASASEISQRRAILNGTVNPEGEATSYYFEYGTKNVLEHKTTVQSLGSGAKFSGLAASAALTGLSPNTEYHAELIVEYGAGVTAAGAEKTFTTTEVAAPKATTEVATAVTQGGATVKGLLSPEGQETSYRFQYGLTKSYENETALEHASAEVSSQATFASLTGLLPNTLYHYRLVAENLSGPSEGEDRTFTTASPPPPPTQPLPSPLPVITSSSPPSPAPTTTLLTPLPTKPVIPPGASLLGSSLKLTAPHHSSALRGTIEVTGGTAGRLEVDLLVRGALLGKTRGGGSKPVRIGRLLRGAVPPGKLSFSVSLTSQGKRALARRHSLPVTVTILFTPTQGQPTTLTRSLTLRA